MGIHTFDNYTFLQNFQKCFLSSNSLSYLGKLCRSFKSFNSLIKPLLIIMDEERFRKLVEEALDSLPEEFAKRLNNVSVIVEDFPSRELLRSLKLPPWALLFGLYQGVPQTKRISYSGVLPDKITIFKKSIERVSNTEEEIKAQIRATVIHEIGHHFGLSEEDLRK